MLNDSAGLGLKYPLDKSAKNDLPYYFFNAAFVKT